MRSVSLHTFENDIEQFRSDYTRETQFEAFKKCYFQLLIVREDIKTTLKAFASIKQLTTKNDEQVEFLVEKLTNALCFVFQKKQAIEDMKKRLSGTLKSRSNKNANLKKKLVVSVAKAKKTKELQQSKLDKIRKSFDEEKRAIDQMKAALDEGDNQSKESETSTLQMDPNLLSNSEDQSSGAANEVMEKFLHAQNTLEVQKAISARMKLIAERRSAALQDVEAKLLEARKRKWETIRVIPQRNLSDINQSIWDF